MKGARFPYLFVGGVLLLLTFVLVSTAIAAKPQVEFRQSEFTDVIDCGDFLAIAEFMLFNRVTFFFDNEGNLVGAQNHGKGRGIVTNSVTGKSAIDRGTFTVFLDFEEGTMTTTGTFDIITVPGEGIVFKDAGRIVFDADDDVIFVAGTHDFWLGDPTALCAAVD